MKTVILALLLLVFVSQGEALWCRCDGKVKVCPSHVEECKAGEICGQILMDDGFTTDYFMGCMTEEKCKGYQFKETSQATCCDWDRCT